MICRKIANVGYEVTDQIVNPISEYNKLTQKECKTMHDWGEKVIHWKLYKNLKFDHTDKWYIYLSTSPH